MMSQKLSQKFLLSMAFVAIFNLSPKDLNASTVAIIDSGNDFEHKELRGKVWTNPKEIAGNDRDEDRNGYQDDVHGWNFAEGNNQLIDYSYSTSYDDDVKRFFDLQLRSMLGTLSETDRTWAKEKLQDKEFINRITIFGNWMHGTHVTGIAAKGNTEGQFLGLKLIPTEVKLPGQKLTQAEAKDFVLSIAGENFRAPANEVMAVREKLLMAALKALATAQAKTMTEIGEYIKGTNAQVVNGSFGTPYSGIANIVGQIYKTLFRKDATESELKKYVSHYFQEALEASKPLVTTSPKSLFVFAAGNEGLNNDQFPTSPANIVAENKIVVAATFYNRSLANFSNYGELEVDVAAPGVGIVSTIPMDQTMAVSGTSQAAPWVANVASQVSDANKNLGPVDIKAILMGTVDKKDWLKGKVKSGGIVNMARAIKASELSQRMKVEDAIQLSFKEIGEESLPKIPASLVKKSHVKLSQSDRELMKKLVLPLPSLIELK